METNPVTNQPPAPIAPSPQQVVPPAPPQPPTSPKKPGLTWLLITGFVIVAFLLGIGVEKFYPVPNIRLPNLPFINPSPTPTSTPTPTPNPTADWKTYLLKDISIKIPSELTQSRASEQNLVLENSDPKAPVDSLIIDSEWGTSNRPCISAEACFKRDLESAKGAFTASKGKNTYETTSSVILGKVTNGIQFDTPLEISPGTNLGGYSDIYYYVDSKNNVVQLSFHVLGNPSVVMQQKALIDQILSTFTFLDNNNSTSNGYVCPPSGYVDCMPVLTPEKQASCSSEAMSWYKTNCPNFKGGAL